MDSLSDTGELPTNALTGEVESPGTTCYRSMSNSVMRTQFIIAFLWALMVSLTVSGQQHYNDGVRISCPLLHSQPIKIVRPTYPELARQTHVEGRVSLNCLVGRDGSIERIEVKKGHPLLIQAAMEAVSQWKFKPLRLNGKTVEMETIVDIDFQLSKNQKKAKPKQPLA